MKHHLIFEGADLAGKSWIMNQVYEYLESKYSQDKNVLDGCTWFNCDVGVFGTEHGLPIIENYLNIFEVLKENNILVEKFHISDSVHNLLYREREVQYESIEKKLLTLGFKIIFITFPEKKDVLTKRIEDRLNLYPHYKRILKTPELYLKQQEEYKQEIHKSMLPSLTINTDTLPDQNLITHILEWIGEV